MPQHSGHKLPVVKHYIASLVRHIGMMLPAAKILASHVDALLRTIPDRPPRPEIAAKIGIGDKTLGILKAGNGNPTLESISAVASYFRRQPWQLLLPPNETNVTTQSQETSGEHLMMAVDALEDALKGLALPRVRYWEAAAISYDCIMQGMPYAEVVDLLRPIVSDAASQGAKNASVSRENHPTSSNHGRRAASGKR
ncbi:hypothetical protein [Solilutibacter silvestris]|uniref:hypothetical protein n=1 Tax=Solilutibacter silvestris TaxID=1645665 RepID=UPI003D347109